MAPRTSCWVFSTVIYFMGYFWPWGWGIGDALLIAAMVIKDDKDDDLF